MNDIVETYQGYFLRAWGRVVAGSSVVVPCFEVYSIAERAPSMPSRLLCWLELHPVSGTQAAVTSAYEAAQAWVDQHLPGAGKS